MTNSLFIKIMTGDNFPGVVLNIISSHLNCDKFVMSKDFIYQKDGGEKIKIESLEQFIQLIFPDYIHKQISPHIAEEINIEMVREILNSSENKIDLICFYTKQKVLATSSNGVAKTYSQDEVKDMMKKFFKFVLSQQK